MLNSCAPPTVLIPTIGSKYADRRGRDYWTKFTYPFGFTDLLTSLDSPGRMGFSLDDPDIGAAIAWIQEECHNAARIRGVVPGRARLE